MNKYVDINSAKFEFISSKRREQRLTKIWFFILTRQCCRLSGCRKIHSFRKGGSPFICFRKRMQKYFYAFACRSLAASVKEKTMIFRECECDGTLKRADGRYAESRCTQACWRRCVECRECAKIEFRRLPVLLLCECATIAKTKECAATGYFGWWFSVGVSPRRSTTKRILFLLALFGKYG